MLAIGEASAENAASLTGGLVARAAEIASSRTDLRIALEGGATAMAFIRRMD